MLSVVTLNVVMLNVIMLNVMAPAELLKECIVQSCPIEERKEKSLLDAANELKKMGPSSIEFLKRIFF